MTIVLRSAALAVLIATVPSFASAGTTPAFPLGAAVMTRASSNTNVFAEDQEVARVWDLRKPPVSPPNVWTIGAAVSVGFTPKNAVTTLPIWSGKNLGQVFGIALDDDQSQDGPYIYVSATAIYGSVVCTPPSANLACTTNEPAYSAAHSNLSTVSPPATSPFNMKPASGLFANDTSGPLYGAIWRLSLAGNLSPSSATLSVNSQGTYELIANIPNSNAMSLGQIAFNPDARVFYVSNFHDGRIYMFTRPSLGSAPLISSAAFARYDHGIDGRTVAGFKPIYDPDQAPLFTSYGRRVWGLQYNRAEHRLYYAVWNSDERVPSENKNQIWSVALDSAGHPDLTVSGAVRREIELPVYPDTLPMDMSRFSLTDPRYCDTSDALDTDCPAKNFSQPVSDIAFNQAGNVMLLAERGERIGRPIAGGLDTTSDGISTLPHWSRILRYRKTGTQWVIEPNPNGAYGEYAGDQTDNATGSAPFQNRTNSAGGVDFGYDYSADAAGLDTQNSAIPDGYAWATVNSWQTLNAGAIYGFQGLRWPQTIVANAATNVNADAGLGVLAPPSTYFVDFDGDNLVVPKTMLGDIEIYRVAAGAPPPASWNCVTATLTAECTAPPIPGQNTSYNLTLTVKHDQLTNQATTGPITRIEIKPGPNYSTPIAPSPFGAMNLTAGQSATAHFRYTVAAGQHQICFKLDVYSQDRFCCQNQLVCMDVPVCRTCLVMEEFNVVHTRATHYLSMVTSISGKVCSNDIVLADLMVLQDGVRLTGTPTVSGSCATFSYIVKSPPLKSVFTFLAHAAPNELGVSDCCQFETTIDLGFRFLPWPGGPFFPGEVGAPGNPHPPPPSPGHSSHAGH